MSATLRGTAILATTSPTLTLTLPTGTVAGDTAVFFAAGAWQINTPSGWTVVCTPTNASNWNGAVFTRVLTSGDISTGTATVTFVNTGDAVAALATIYSSVSNPVSLAGDFVQQSSGSSTVTVTSINGATGKLALYWGSNHSSATATVNRGTLQRTANNGANALGSLYAETLSSTGSVSAIYSYSVPGSGNYEVNLLASDTPSNARLTQTAMEGVITGSPNALLTQLSTEAVAAGPANVHLTNLGVEVLIGTPAPTQRGNIDYDQIRSSVRQGTGSQFQMFGGGTTTAGNGLVFDANGNAVDSGSAPGSGSVATTRTINTTAPLTGGGNLSADRTLAVSLATTSTVGVVKADGTTITIDGTGTISSSGGVPTTRTISTTAPLIGGGDLSANRTLGVSLATTSTVGVVKADGTTITIDGTGKISSSSATGSGAPLVIGFSMNDGSTGTNVGPMLPAPHTGTVTQCVVVTKASDPAIPLTFTIKQNGTAIFSSAPTIAAATASGTVSTFTALTSSPLAVTANDVFSIDITSGSSAWKFIAQIEGVSIVPLAVGFVVTNGTPGTNIGPLMIAPRAGSVTKCLVAVKASDPSTGLTFTINKNGVSGFSSAPTVAAGTASGTVSTFTTLTSSPLAVAANDVFSIDITSGTSSWKFTAQLE